MTHILQLDIAGNPFAWATKREAISLIACDRVLAGLGEHNFTYYGGTNRASGKRSSMVVNSILLSKQRVAKRRTSSDYEPPLTNKALFARDRYMCLYCGKSLSPGQLTRDHIIPGSRNGPDSWTNTATSCRKCNENKGDKTPEEWGRLLLAIPFAPNWSEYLYLKNSQRIIADQMGFLKARFPNNSPLS